MRMQVIQVNAYYFRLKFFVLITNLMNTTMKELTQLSLTIIIFLTIISCEDFLTVHPLGFASSSNLIHSEQGITQLLHRVYDPDQGLENYEEGSFNTKGIGMDSRKDA